MEVLLRCNLKWKEAAYENSKWFVDGAMLNETEIIAVRDDNRNEYVVCTNCGEVFRKGSQELHDHTHQEWKPEMCFECGYLSVRTGDTISKEYHKDENGNWVKNQSNNVSLMCANTPFYTHIESEAAIHSCKHMKCNEERLSEITDFFTENPGAFDDMITVDRLVEMKCRREGERSFKVRSKKTILAYIDDHNIVSHFYVTARRCQFYLVYSKKYDKLFHFSGNKYQEFTGHYALPDDEFHYIKEKIAGLYQ